MLFRLQNNKKSHNTREAHYIYFWMADNQSKRNEKVKEDPICSFLVEDLMVSPGPAVKQKESS
jgi:hypothetical protein